MDFSLRSMFELARFSIESPRAAARSLMAMNLPGNARWLLFLISVIASALASYAGFRQLPAEMQVFWADAMSRPVQSVILQAAFWLLVVAGLREAGRWGGKKGSFADTLLLVSWWQILFVCLQVIQILARLVVPLLGEMLGLVGLVVVMWLLTQFIMELHGFQHFWRVLPLVLAALVVGAVGLGVILAVLVFAFTGRV